MTERILTGHTKGDDVFVDWCDGHEPEPAMVIRREGHALHLRFPGEARNRVFVLSSEPRGLWRSEKGQLVEVYR